MAAKNACLLSFVTAAAVSCAITYADAAPAKPPVVMLYVGAYPEGPDNKGLPAPADLAEPFVAARNPQGNSAFNNIEIYYALSFAQDAPSNDHTDSTWNNCNSYDPPLAGKDCYTSGDYKIGWDPTLTPNKIQQAKNDAAQNGRRMRFLGSIAGGSFIWCDPRDSNGVSIPDDAIWVDNAFDSLTNMRAEYHLDGFDIQYERFGGAVGCTGNKFASLWGKLVKKLKKEDPSIIITATPFKWTMGPYKTLFSEAGRDNIDWINYQPYTMPNWDQCYLKPEQTSCYQTIATKDQYINEYATVADEFGVKYEKLTLGIAASEWTATVTDSGALKEGSRGLQAPAIYDAAIALHDLGLRGVFFWTIEQMRANGQHPNLSVHGYSPLLKHQAILQRESCSPEYMKTVFNNDNDGFHLHMRDPKTALRWCLDAEPPGGWPKADNCYKVLDACDYYGDEIVNEGITRLCSASYMESLFNDSSDPFHVHMRNRDTAIRWCRDAETYRWPLNERCNTVLVACQKSSVYDLVDTLRENYSLRKGERIYSQNGLYALIYQGDGNLVLYNTQNWAALWASKTVGSTPGKVFMDEGNLHILNASNSSIWRTTVQGNTLSYLVVQNDGNLVIYKQPGGPRLWAAR